MGKLSRDDIPQETKPPCIAGRLIAGALDADDLQLVEDELAGGISMIRVVRWIAPALQPGSCSDSSMLNHLTGTCSCPAGVPLHGVRARG